MRGVVYSKDGGLRLDTNLADPQRRPGEAKVKVIRAGICSTDIELMKGYMDFSGVLGHEFVGRVEEVDEDNSRGIRVGDRVVGEISLPCGRCSVCAAGGVARRNHCGDRVVLGILAKDGAWADHLTLPVDNLHRVPHGVSDEAAAFAEPLAAAFRIVEQNLIPEGAEVAVVGDGKLGLLIVEAIRASKLTGRLTAFGRHERKLGLLPGDVDKVVVSGGDTEVTYDSRFDVVVEATGSPSGLMMAVKLTRPLGTLVLKTTCAAGSGDFDTAPIVIKEINLVGSRCGNFEMALKALDAGDVVPSKLVAHVYPVSQALEAVAHARRRGTLKIQLLFD